MSGTNESKGAWSIKLPERLVEGKLKALKDQLSEAWSTHPTGINMLKILNEVRQGVEAGNIGPDYASQTIDEVLNDLQAAAWLRGDEEEKRLQSAQGKLQSLLISVA